MRGAWIAFTLAACQEREFFTTADGEANNIVLAGDVAYASLAGEGFAVVDATTGELQSTRKPPQGTQSVDDLAFAGGRLFLLDARGDGFLSVQDATDPMTPMPLGDPAPARVGPFTGVSAAMNVAVVSGGTTAVTVFGVDQAGSLGGPTEIDIGGGQPDVLVDPLGDIAYLSTHFSGDDFGGTTLSISAPGQPVVLDRFDLACAGFTAGVGAPANFPIESALVGDRWLVAFGAGLAVLDASDPAAVELIATLDVGVAAVGVDVDGDLAALVGVEPDPELVFVDVSDAAAPRVVSRVAIELPSKPTAVVLTPSLALVAAHEAGVLAFERPPG